MASRKAVVCLPNGLGEPAAGDVLVLPPSTVAALGKLTGTSDGAVAWASDGRAFILTASVALGTVTYTVTQQAAGKGTGVLATYSATAAAWQVAGTTTIVSA